MLRYKNESTVGISVSIKDDYEISVEALWNSKTKKYTSKFYIVRTDIGTKEPIGKLDNIYFESTINTIKIDIAKYITKLNDENFFDYYIRLYEYIQRCFDRGNELFEQERINNAGEI